jgi:type IV pilus assembly protein PilA
MNISKRQKSVRGFTLVEIMIVVVIIGLLAAMAVPAFTKVRQSSQDKAIINNIRQIVSAADQYYLENGVTTVSTTLLVGSTLYIKSIATVANEVYPDALTQGAEYGVTVQGRDIKYTTDGKYTVSTDAAPATP